MDIAVNSRVEGSKKLDENYIYGCWGIYQVVQAVIIFLLILPTGFQLLVGVFIGYRPGFRCAASSSWDDLIIANSSLFVTHEKCHVKLFYNDSTRDTPKLVRETPCTKGYFYTLDKDSTFVTEMDLVCDQGYLGELVQTLVMAGQLVGAAFASSLSDRFGRKTVLLTSHLLTFALGIGVAFSPNYTTLAVLKFLLGVLQQGMVMSNAVLCLELFPEKTRFYAEAIGLFSWTTGLVVMAPMAYLMRGYSWRYLQVLLTSFSVFSLVQYWVQNESLRWLAANGKTEAAERVMRKVARWNKIRYEDLNKIVMKRMTSNDNPNDVDTEKKEMTENTKDLKIVVEKYSIITILRSKNIFIISLIMWFTWLTNTVTYFGLTLNSTSLAGDRFLNFFLSSCVEYIAVILEYCMLRCLGRRTILMVFHAVCGTALASATLLHHFSGGDSRIELASVVTTFAGKMAITGSFSTLFLYTPELYPTNLRNAGIGFSSSFSRLGAIVSPYVGTLAEKIPWAPGTIFTVMCFTVILILLYVPETRGHELPQTLAEVKVWYTEHSGRRQRNKKETTKL
uniref:Solute carrier family 22 member 6-A-like n=1 Tax=Crassostrea virginica TaxID=6565 RepID=A0A8B8DZD1_CRAVI|nr:solute carrier family 22 member 6-A-like [Crassostrea virginica]